MGRTQINLQVSPGTKEEWEQYAQESAETSSLSHLIRLSVTEHMAGSDGQDTSDRTEQGSEATGEILSALTQIDNKVTDLQDRMGAVEREQDSAEGYDFRKVVYEMLPEGEPRSRGDGITAEDIARRIGADESDVTDALGTLTGETAGVSSATNAPPDGSEPRTVYFRRGGN